MGNGRATALRFAQEGAKVMSVDRALALAEETAKLVREAGGDCFAFEADVTRETDLAAMVADPRDLVSPRPLDPDDAQRRLTVLEKYRKGETTVAEKAASQSGAVTAVAQGGGM